MKATIYKELSNKQTPIELQVGLTVQEALPDLDLENAIIVINGRIENCNYVLQEKDKATIRLTPSGTTALIVTAIVLSVVAVGAGIAGGIYAYNAKLQAEKAQAELEKMKKLSNRPEVDNRPFLRGASNTIATGANQPYIIGRHFFTPYLLSQPFYEITGADGINQYTYTVLECGFNKQVLKKIAIDDVIIKTFTDTAPQEGGYDLDTGIFAEGGRIEIAQDGGLLTDIPALNYKVESKTCNDEIPRDSEVSEGKKEYLTYTLNPYAMSVDIAITFPYGLFAVDDKGDKIETQLTITPQYSLDGGASWNDFTFNNNGIQTNLFKRNVSTQELRYTAHKDFTAEHYKTLKANNQTAIYIRVRSNGNKDSAIKNDCYCLFYQSKCFDPDKSGNTELVPCKIIEDRERAFCTILGLKLKASKINEEKLKKINVISQGIARTWTGTKWSEEKSETRNPAAWALEIETSDSHPASKYKDSELDLESFGEFYEYCEEKGYKFDWVITQNTKKDDTLNHIMEATGACIYRDIYGRRAIAIDKPQENALAVYNPQNIISIQNKKTFSRRTDGLRIKYVNSKDDLYQEDTYLLMREVNGEPLEITPDSIIKDINITGITTFEHIVKYARRLMAIEALRPKTTIIEVGNEGIFYTPYSKILIQDDSLKIGIGKGYTIAGVEWDGLLLKKIYTNEPLTLEATETYGIIVNCFTERGVYPLPIKVAGDGETNELIVLTEIKAGSYARPDKGNVFSLGEIGMDGEFTKVSTPYIISQIKRSDKGFNLELVNYHEAIYESGTIPDYKSNITQRKSTIKKSIPPNLNAKDGKDGTTKFLPSLEVQGDYENQIGTYQGQLYRWTNSKWELLNAVMPLNPVLGWDFTSIGEPDGNIIKQWKNIKSDSFYILLKENINHLKGRTFFVIFDAEKLTADKSNYPELVIYMEDWQHTVLAFYSWKLKRQVAKVDIPDVPENIYVMVANVHRTLRNDTDCQNCKSIINELTFREIYYKTPIIDFSDNKHNGKLTAGLNVGKKTLIDNSIWETVKTSMDILPKEITVSVCLNLDSKQDKWRVEDVLNKSIVNYTYDGSYGNLYNYCFSNTAKGKEVKVTYQLEKKKADNTPIEIFIIEDGWSEKLYEKSILTTQDNQVVYDSAVVTLPDNNKTYRVGFYYRGDTPIRLIACSVFINDKKNYSYVFCVGDLEKFDLRPASGICVSKAYDSFSTEECAISIPTNLLCDKKSILTVNTKVTKTSCTKKVYLNGKLFEEKTQQGDFSYLYKVKNREVYIGSCKGEYYNFMIFDRLLTEQEILWLALNPQYPIKNYTLADWSISPDNPDNVLASSTPKYLGVVETQPSTRTAVITKGERLGAVDANPGDWVLSGKTIGEWKVGVCYRWSGLAWKPLEPEVNYSEVYQACLVHLFDIEELKQQTGHYGALFAKVLVAQKALIDELLVNQAFIKNLVVQKLKIDTDDTTHQDFEAWFDETTGLKINNGGEEIFSVDTSGNVYAKNATLTDAYFNGNIVSGPLELLNAEPTSTIYNLISQTTARSICEQYGGIDIICENRNGGTPVHRFITQTQSIPVRVPIYEMDYNATPPKLKFVRWEIGMETTYIVRIFTDIGERIYKNDEKITENYSLSSKKGSKTLKLKNLPTTKPTTKGVVWVDNEVLKIS